MGRWFWSPFWERYYDRGKGETEKVSLLWGRYHSMLVFEHLSNLMSGFGKRLGALSLYVQGDFDCTAFVNQNIAKGATDPWVSLAYQSNLF